MSPDQVDFALVVAASSALGALAFAVSRHRRRRTEAKAYLRGVRSMLSGDPDTAIEALSDAARLGTPQALETYLALGELFRRTGDLSRALRLHKNMLVGLSRDAPHRPEIERALAEDYRRSGMLAEAAELLEPRAAGGDRRATEALRDVRADQGAWRDAAALQARLGGGGPDRLRAHLLASAARAELAAAPPQVEAARQAGREAVAADPGCADGLFALAEAEAAGGDGAAALAALGRGLDVAPGAAVLAWPAVLRVPDRAAALAFLDRRVEAAPSDAALLMLRGRLLRRLGRREEALAAVRRALDLDTSGAVTAALRDLLREGGTPSPEDLAASHELVVAALRRRVPEVTCVRCGAEAPSQAWRCRSCGAFDAFP